MRRQYRLGLVVLALVSAMGVGIKLEGETCSKSLEGTDVVTQCAHFTNRDLLRENQVGRYFQVRVGDESAAFAHTTSLVDSKWQEVIAVRLGRKSPWTQLIGKEVER